MTVTRRLLAVASNIWRRALLLVVRSTRDGSAYARFLGVIVGEDCRILTRDFGSEPFLITIGSRVTITNGVQLITHDGSTWLIRDEEGRRYHYSPIKIGDDVFVGLNSIILPGVRIGNRVIVAAGSVVTKSIPDGLVVGGNPARVIATYEHYRQKVLSNCVSERAIGKSMHWRNARYREEVMRHLDIRMRPDIGEST